MVAGHETVANALAWACWLMLREPGIYAWVQTEVDDVLRGRMPTADDLPHLPAVLQVLKEAMRLYPPAYVISRLTTRPLLLGPYHIPAGTTMLVSPYTLHRQPQLFPDPERFEPARFAPEVEQQMPRFAYLPFGAGPHTCIGNYFALQEAHIVLATLIQRVSFTLVPHQQVEPAPLVTLRPKPGIKVIIHHRRAESHARHAISQAEIKN